VKAITVSEIFWVMLTVAGVLLAKLETHTLVAVFLILVALFLLSKGVIPMFKGV
jgi:hypothetical protein